MPYKVAFKPSAADALRRLPRKVQAQVIRKVESLAADPRPRGCTKLAGSELLWRVRAGDYRVVYEVRDDVLTVVVLKVAHRSHVYRGL